MKKTLLTFAFLSWFCTTDSETSRPVKHPDYVPDEQTAIKVAEAIWLPIFGEMINHERPFTAYLANNVWHVSGTKPDSSFGGVAMIEIRKSDCKVLSVAHPK